MPDSRFKVAMKEDGFKHEFHREPNNKIDSIEVNIKSDMVCSNINRIAILHVLRNCPKKQMQAEKLAQMIGVSHRTVLYHLDILEDYELVEVRAFRKKGKKMLRSVWGLNTDNVHVEKVFGRIWKKFPPEQITRSLKMNGYAR
jgi:DNA-binding transcriptional ArsR family regulator